MVLGNKLGFGIPLPGIRASSEAGIRDSLLGIRGSLQKSIFHYFLRRDSPRDSGFPPGIRDSPRDSGFPQGFGIPPGFGVPPGIRGSPKGFGIPQGFPQRFGIPPGFETPPNRLLYYRLTIHPPPLQPVR